MDKIQKYKNMLHDEIKSINSDIYISEFSLDCDKKNYNRFLVTDDINDENSNYVIISFKKNGIKIESENENFSCIVFYTDFDTCGISFMIDLIVKIIFRCLNR